MVGCNDGNRVAPVGSADRAHCGGMADLARDLAIAAGLAVGDGQEGQTLVWNGVPAKASGTLSGPTGESIRLKTRFMSSMPRCFAASPPRRRIPSAAQPPNERAGDYLGGPPAQFAFVVRTSPRPCGSAPRTPEIGAAKVSDERSVDPIDRTKEVHLADIDAVVAEDRVGHRDMEIDVRDRHL